MKKIKRFLTSILCVVFMLIAAPLNGFVGLNFPELKLPEWTLVDFGVKAEAAKSGIYTYTVTDNKVTITGCDTSASGSITIPSQLGGYSVTRIGSAAFYDCTNLTSVAIPDSITSIGSKAFYNCSSLARVYYIGDIESWCKISFSDYYANPMYYAKNFYINSILVKEIVIPDIITEIKDYTFCSFESITSVTLGNSVKKIGNYAFYNCTAIKVLTLPASAKIYNSSYTFYNCTNIEKVTLTKGTGVMQNYINNSINSDTYYVYTPWYVSTKIKEISIEDGIKNIGSYSFNGLTGLTSVIIPDSVTSIGDYAFSYCRSLTSITIPDSVTSIGDSAFSSCTSLTSITIPDSVTSIGIWAFSSCTSLTSVTISDSVTSIGDSAFENCTSLTSITVDVNNAYYSSDEYGVLFNKDRYLLICYPKGKEGSYTIPDGVTSIGAGAFENCTSLTSIVIPDSVTSIGAGAFENCTSLKSPTIPNSVTSIGSSAFYFCGNLTSVTIPDSVTSIGSKAFFGCDRLASVTIGDGVTSIGYAMFANCFRLKSVTIGNSVTSIGESAFYDCIALKELTLPVSATIYNSLSTFYNCTNIEKVTLTKGTGIMQNYSNYEKKSDTYYKYTPWYISGCSTIIIEDGVTSIGDYAFYCCTSITDVYYTGDIESWCNISFGNSSSQPMRIAYRFYINGELLKNLEIPEGITVIKAGVFYNFDCVKTVTIPESVITIREDAFYGCDSIEKVYYLGTEAQWDEIAIYNGNESLEKANKIFFNGEHEHVYNSTVTTKPTCTKTGVKVIKCYCGNTLTESIPATGHIWMEWIIKTEPTVSSTGLASRTCSVCYDCENKTLSKLVVIDDTETGVQLIYGSELPVGTTMEVEAVTDDRYFQILNNTFGKINSQVINVSLIFDEEAIQPNGKVKVKVPVPESFAGGVVFVCCFDVLSGNFEKLYGTVENRCIVFETEHIGTYAIVEQLGEVHKVSLNDVVLTYKNGKKLNPDIKIDVGVDCVVLFESSNEYIVTVDEDGNIIGVGTGEAEITVTVTDEYGNVVEDTCKVTVSYSWWQWLMVIFLFGWIWY